MNIFVSLPAQTLELFADDELPLRHYLVSTAKKGAGERGGSLCTPRGRHWIRAKIGAGCPENAVFVGRRPTGEAWTPALAERFPGRDWILTRILWLSGREPGFNRLGDVDTMRRYIYLHGVPDVVRMGEPGSIGCVRMRNRDVIELFDLVAVHTRVMIGDYRIDAGEWERLGAFARTVRDAVFVREQGVPQALEWDDFDAVSLHAVAFDAAGSPIGTGRLLADGHVGRMAVLAPWRSRGVGAALLRRLLGAAQAAGQRRIVLHAQTHARDFYAAFGFAPEGGEFMEAGIPHIKMSRALRPAAD